MATFKVGQRVKIVSLAGWDPGETGGPPLGAEGIVVEVDCGCWRYIVDMPGYLHQPTDMEQQTHWGFDGPELAPLTDPGADAFLERIRKLKPYDEPKVEHEWETKKLVPASTITDDDARRLREFLERHK